jgi:hypothetical protein
MARSFFRSMMQQTGEWSAPLDDVFIHFDYARSIAEGYPFEWVAGNGISSGNTSLTYPFVLALGVLLGFSGAKLLVFAGWLSCVCVFALTLAAQRIGAACFKGKSRVLSQYIAPPAVLALGALNWSLFSGMEVAFFLGLWSFAFVFFLTSTRSPLRKALVLSGACMLLCATRPEAIGTAAVFSLALPKRAKMSAWNHRMHQTLIVCAPAALLVAQACFNRIATGEWTQNGALVKLALYNPYLSLEAKLDDFWFNLKYTVFRNVEYHFADVPVYGYALLALAALGLAARETRRLALVLLMMIAAWLPIVALNGQVRWQNERYTMPAVAWLMIMAGLGFVSLLRAKKGAWSIPIGFAVCMVFAQALATGLRDPGPPVIRLSLLANLAIASLGAVVLIVPWVRRGLGVALACLFVIHQEPNMRGQRWFFGRACRNIRDQQRTLGRSLAEIGTLGPNVTLDKKPRVLVGDAGAILYESNWKGLDLIGLGGLWKLPFARANVQGLGASLELVERLPEQERPQVMAIFPSWWGALPVWFGGALIRRFPAEGNVICGDYEHVLYAADWHLLGTGEALMNLPAGTHDVKDTLDTGDIVSEREHKYDWFPKGKNGFATMRILPRLAGGREDVFDGGREIMQSHSEAFTLSHLEPQREAHLVIRSAPEGDARVHVIVNDIEVAITRFARSADGEASFIERPIRIPAELVRSAAIQVRLENDGPQKFTDFHIYITQ